MDVSPEQHFKVTDLKRLTHVLCNCCPFVQADHKIALSTEGKPCGNKESSDSSAILSSCDVPRLTAINPPVPFQASTPRVKDGGGIFSTGDWFSLHCSEDRLSDLRRELFRLIDEMDLETRCAVPLAKPKDRDHSVERFTDTELL